MVQKLKDSHIQTRALTGVSRTFSIKNEFKWLGRRPFENRIKLKIPLKPTI